MKNCRKRGLNKIHAQQLFSEFKLNLLARAFSEFSGKTWSAKRAQKIRKTGAKNRKRAQFQKVFLWILLWNPFCSENCPFEMFAVKICQWFMFGYLCSILSVCCQISTRNQLIHCSEKPSCMHAMIRTLKDLQKVLAWPNDFSFHGVAGVPDHSCGLYGQCFTVAHACHMNVACMSHECCTHVPWMLHAACQMHFAFMRVARLAWFHAWTAAAFLHACMYGPVFCMHEHGCMHADAKIVQLLLSSVPHVWTKRCVASPFL